MDRSPPFAAQSASFLHSLHPLSFWQFSALSRVPPCLHPTYSVPGTGVDPTMRTPVRILSAHDPGTGIATLVYLFADGTGEVSHRASPADTWGSPTLLRPVLL